MEIFITLGVFLCILLYDCIMFGFGMLLYYKPDKRNIKESAIVSFILLTILLSLFCALIYTDLNGWLNG